MCKTNSECGLSLSCFKSLNDLLGDEGSVRDQGGSCLQRKKKHYVLQLDLTSAGSAVSGMSARHADQSAWQTGRCPSAHGSLTGLSDACTSQHGKTNVCAGGHGGLRQERLGTAWERREDRAGRTSSRDIWRRTWVGRGED